MAKLTAFLFTFLASAVFSLRYDPTLTRYNLNTNQKATNPLDYTAEWPGHVYHPSPDNWRFPFYTLFLDRYVNGDPSNDNANGTVFEVDPYDTQFRHGGDLAGLVDTLDYIQGMGVKALYVAGTAYINAPFHYDSYSPLDLTLLDFHYGDIDEWRAAVAEVHKRGMYIVLDNTLSTLGDLLGFDGFLNTSTPFEAGEHKVIYKSDRQYTDFRVGDNYNATCEYPRFWNGSGQRVLRGSDPTFDKLKGCYDSEFDQYGDTEAFGNFPDWQRELSKFASLQDRLREWNPVVRSKLALFSCMTIAMLDIDGFRYDKATQVTVDALGDYAQAVRSCANDMGKKNFFLPGEITGSDSFGSIYLGRGREPEQRPKNITAALLFDSDSKDVFLRDKGKGALDAAAFHYSMYRFLQRHLGMDGNITIPYDIPDNLVNAWNTMSTTNDFVNSNTGEFDPRHMWGTSNQDVFRWPAIQQGTEKMLLGQFLTTLHMPGIPLLLWGEEQAFYILDNTASNYVFGRPPISSAQAWQNHGCYKLGSTQYYDFPVESASHGCEDDSVSLDHRDPTHPVRNIIKSMYRLRVDYPVLNDGFFLQSLSNLTHQIFLPGSNGTATEIGIWSVIRDQYPGVQNLGGSPQPVWLLWHNDNKTVTYDFNCNDNDTALISPFPTGTTVKNLMAPYEEFTLGTGPKKLFLDKSEKINGCIDKLQLEPFAFKAFVPKAAWIAPPPTITHFTPGHDTRILAANTGSNTVKIVFEFSDEMDCDAVTKNLIISSTTTDTAKASIDTTSVNCGKGANNDTSNFVGHVESTWAWTANLINVPEGIHTLTLSNLSSQAGVATGTTDHVMFRVGKIDNPIVFPRTANYSQEILTKDSAGVLSVKHKANGADRWRYSLNWGSTYSAWTEYKGGNSVLAKQPWSGTKRQEWKGDHVILEYWSQAAGSSAHVQHGDSDPKQTPRRFPHLFAQGPFNQYGFDAGLKNDFSLKDGVWTFGLMTEWPAKVQLNVWGINPDGKPDQTWIYGDVDNDTVLDRTSPGFNGENVLNLTTLPPSPFVAYRVQLEDATMKFTLIPTGSRLMQILVFALIWVIPVLTGAISIWTYMGAFYRVKFNASGLMQKTSFALPFGFRRKFQKLPGQEEDHMLQPLQLSKTASASGVVLPTINVSGAPTGRRTVLIATMEYDIEDWKIKIKIGGLGVMAQLMGKSLTHQDLIWVVPCVGGVDYPIDTIAEPMTVQILGVPYTIEVQYHKLNNITYVLLDAPIFRQQSKSEPYPPRMDDLDSAVYYSAWNACIAECCNRFPVDIYHINDYHGAAAPLYLLPKTIPCCLSLHNAEFQGLWPMRSPKEQEEVCRVYNLDKEIVEKYVQFGEVFNLLHAGASYLRVHQKGFGAVGVSNKYGARSYARYPIFWGLKEIGKLPNPDPSDTEPWDREAEARQVITVDPAYEASRGDLRRQAQEWAGLEVDPTAELFVFVGRWSNQKGLDLIADCFPAVLEKHPKVQLICIGPVIDLYGKFAALKLGIMMKKYPKRVYSKPEFTALPPFIFTGAEFALIPSRDEPFGLVAVEFGRKGALGVGARVGGLGQMPGWWYTVESTTTQHLQKQFKSAIEEALNSKTKERAEMRAKSAKQRFPVARWVEDLNILQSTAIRVHNEEAGKGRGLRSSSGTSNRLSRSFFSGSGSTDRLSMYGDASSQVEAFNTASPQPDRPVSRDRASGGLGRTLSLGVRNGPGHRARYTGGDMGEPVREDDDSVYSREEEYEISREQAETAMVEDARREGRRSITPGSGQPGFRISLAEPDQAARGRSRDRGVSPSPELRYSHSPETRQRSVSPGADASLLGAVVPRPRLASRDSANRLSVLSLNDIKGTKTDFNLQHVDPTFEDKDGQFYNEFEQMLQDLSGKNSEKDLCIEQYLVDSEKAWFKRMREAKLGRSRDKSPGGRSRPVSAHSSVSDLHAGRRPLSGSAFEEDLSDDNESTFNDAAVMDDEFLLGKDYQRPSALKRLLQTRIGDWPIYSLMLALGQIMAANSYQITLLTGGQGETPEKLYIVGGIYMVSSCIWWLMYRRLKSLFVLSIPFFIYGLAFVCLGVGPFIPKGGGRDWIRNVATGFYTLASASGSIFFALNFGDEGGAPIKAWVFRACVIQGTQQIYITALFYWGTTLTAATSKGKTNVNALTDSPHMAFFTLPIAAILMALGAILFTSLPPYYRQTPGSIPNFYRTLYHRKLILWFFAMVILQNYFLSTPYGRNWGYLWSSEYAPQWAIAILVVVFFVIVWAIMLFIFSKLSKKHSWILPIFAIGLGAPRWAQILWGTSGIGTWLPWMPGGPLAGALAGRSLWLWLGVLDSVQGVGFGMILLQTLTRIHIAVSLIAAQLIGTAVTLIAKATAPDKDGPGDVFPNFATNAVGGISKPWFWIALACQLIIPIGFFKFFRKEQLSKP